MKKINLNGIMQISKLIDDSNFEKFIQKSFNLKTITIFGIRDISDFYFSISFKEYRCQCCPPEEDYQSISYEEIAEFLTEDAFDIVEGDDN